MSEDTPRAPDAIVRESSASQLLAQIDAEQQRLRDLLSGVEGSPLAERPTSDKWSVLENVRHLIFAEQSHLGRFVPGGRVWSPLGLPPTGMQQQNQLRVMDPAAKPAVAAVLEAWETAHSSILPFVQGDAPAVHKALARNLRHLRTHVRVIERLFRAPAPGARRIRP